MTATESAPFSARGLTKHYNELTYAVHNIGFTVASGTVAAVVGPQGAGKTTILRILLGLVEPTEGTASVAAEGAERDGRGIGALLTPRGLHPQRTVRDHLCVHAAAVGASSSRVDEVLELTGSVEQAQVRAAELTPGAETKAGLATALLGKPRLLVLDEPLAGLDPAEQNWLYEFLRGHARRGGTVVFSSPSLATSLPVADGLVVLSEGTMVYQGTPARLRRSNPDRLVVATSAPLALATMLATHGVTDAMMRPDGRLAVAEATETDIAAAADAAGVRVDNIVADLIHPDRVLASLLKRATPRAVIRPGPGQLPPAPPSTPYGIPR